MKKLKIILLSFIVVFFLTACGGEPTYSAAEWESIRAEEEREKALSEERKEEAKRKEIGLEVQFYLGSIDTLEESVFPKALEIAKSGEAGKINEDESLQTVRDLYREALRTIRAFYVPEVCENYHKLELSRYQYMLNFSQALVDKDYEKVDRLTEEGSGDLMNELSIERNRLYREYLK